MPEYTAPTDLSNIDFALEEYTAITDLSSIDFELAAAEEYIPKVIMVN